MLNFTRFTTPLVVLVALGTGVVQASRLDTGGHPQTIVPASYTISPGYWTGVTVTLTQSSTTSTTVYLSSSNPDLLQVPSSVVVPAGNTSFQFAAAAPMQLPDDFFGRLASYSMMATVVTISASANGQTVSTNVTVL